MTCSPGVTPDSMILRFPESFPSVTGSIVTLLSAPTTATWYCPCVSITAAGGTSSAPFSVSVGERIFA